MKNRAVLSLRWSWPILAIGLLAVGIAACSGSQPMQSGPGAEFTPLLNPAPTSTPMPVTVVVPASFAADSEPEESSQQSGNATDPTATPMMGDAAANSVIITPEQIVAAFEDLLHSIYEEALPSVVYIRVANPAGDMFRGIPSVPEDFLWSAGSGFVWDEQGHIVTNHHVVETASGVAEEVTVFFADDTQAQARVVGSDPHSDLAVIRLEDGEWDLRPAPLGDSSEVRVGQLSVAIGAPFGQEFTMTSGIVSALGRNIRGEGSFTIPEVIQTDSAINPGNSGGPLLDRLGRVIGINTQIISNTGNYSGVGMAVPVNIAKRVVPPLIAEGEFDYPWLGVSIASVDPAYAEELELPEGTPGALVITVVDDSPAAEAGMRGSEFTVEVNGVDYPAGGDVIIAIGSHEVVGSSQLIAHLTYHNSPGDTVRFTVLRDGQEMEIEVTLGRRPEPSR